MKIKIKYLLIMILILQFLDVYSTIYFVKRIGIDYETNPLGRFFFNKAGYIGLLIFGIIGCGLWIFYFYLFKKIFLAMKKHKKAHLISKILFLIFCIWVIMDKSRIIYTNFAIVG